MNEVIAFPRPARVTRQTIGRSVVVASRGSLTVALVETEWGWLILEETPDRQHAIDDGRRYAARFGLSFRIQDKPFVAGTAPRNETGGEIYIAPSERAGGSWDVIHQSRSGDSSAIIGNGFAYEDAERMALRMAEEIGATFDDGSGPFAA